EPQYWRAPHLVLHWARDGIVAENFADRRRVPIEPFVVELLDRCGARRTGSDLAVGLGTRASRLAPLLAQLERVGLLRSSKTPSATLRRDAAYARWDEWNPAAGYFHATTV